MTWLDSNSWIFWAAQLLPLAAFAFVFRRRRDLAGARIGLVAAGAVLALLILAMLPLGLHGFGAMHLTFAFGAVTVPIALLVTAAASPTPRSRIARSLLWIAALAPVTLAVYATLVEPRQVRVETASFEASVSRELRVGVIADIQTDDVGAFEHDALQKLMLAGPDVILIAGDFFQGPTEAFEAERPELVRLLSRLSAPLGVYAVLGDVDRRETLAPLLADAGITLLENESVTLDHHGTPVALLGLGLYVGDADANRAVADFVTAGRSGLSLVLAHRPDAVLQLPPDSGVDLVVAGHTHGGQVVIPFFGPLITLTSVPREAAAGGLHTVEGHRLYVSRGLGMERGQAPRVRFGAPPEVAVVRVLPSR